MEDKVRKSGRANGSTISRKFGQLTWKFSTYPHIKLLDSWAWDVAFLGTQRFFLVDPAHLSSGRTKTGCHCSPHGYEFRCKFGRDTFINEDRQ